MNANDKGLSFFRRGLAAGSVVAVLGGATRRVKLREQALRDLLSLRDDVFADHFEIFDNFCYV